MIQISNLSFKYPNQELPALQRVNISVEAGEFLLIAGPTGSGKSSLLMAINGLAPSFTGGELEGSIKILGNETIGSKPFELAHLIGYVNQRPEGSFVAETVLEELAFGLEQMGIPQPEMHERIADVAASLNLTGLLDRAVNELSGGEQQRVAIAAALIIGQRILLLDEPTSALDRKSAKSLISLLRSLALQRALTVIITEHRFEHLLEDLEFVAVINHDGTLQKHDLRASSRPPFLQTNQAWNLERIASGPEIVGVLGANGSGKSTWLWQLQEQGGAVMVPQFASDLLFLQTVRAEFEESDRHAKVAAGSTAKLFASLVGRINPNLHPRDLSAGQQLALVLAIQLNRNEPVLLLDEPTRGLDQNARFELAKQLRDLQKAGKKIVVATHDEHFLHQATDRVISIAEARLGGVTS